MATDQAKEPLPNGKHTRSHKHSLGNPFQTAVGASEESTAENSAPGRIREGGKADAIWEAVKVNAKNGVLLTKSDLQKAVKMVVQAWPDRSNVMIAELSDARIRLLCDTGPKIQVVQMDQLKRAICLPTKGVAFLPSHESIDDALPEKELGYAVHLVF